MITAWDVMRWGSAAQKRRWRATFYGGLDESRDFSRATWHAVWGSRKA
jgi:hypothetical protein